MKRFKTITTIVLVGAAMSSMHLAYADSTQNSAQDTVSTVVQKSAAYSDRE